MILAPATWNSIDAKVFQHDPTVRELARVLYLPRTSPHDEECGLYEETGRQLLSSTLFEGHPGHPKWGGLVSTVSDSIGHAEFGQAIYGGAIGLHYGHFITECMNTLWWFYRHGKATDTVVFHSSGTVVDMFAVPYVAELLKLVGIHRDRVLIPKHPTVFEHLVVPSPAFCEDAFVYRTFAEFCDEIGGRADRQSSWTTNEPVFLSRQRLESDRGTFSNEAEIVAVLERAKVQIVYPEQLPLSDQIALFRRSPFVLGVVGSAFHTSIFSRGAQAISLTPEKTIRRSFPLMDAVSGAQIDYLYPVEQEQPSECSGASQRPRMSDPHGVANELLRRIGSRLDNPRRADRSQPHFPQLAGFSADLSGKLFRVSTADGEVLGVDRATGWLKVYSELPDNADPLLAIQHNDVILLAAECEQGPAVRVYEDDLGAPVLPYKSIAHGEFLALYNPVNDRYLTAIPAQYDRPVACQGKAIGGWELLALTAYPGPADLGRLDDIVRAISQKAVLHRASQERDDRFAYLDIALKRIERF